MVPCGGGNVPPCSLTGFVLHAFGGGNYHPLMGSGGKSIVAMFMSEFFFFFLPPISETVHSVHCLTRGEAAFMPEKSSWNTYDGERTTA